MRSFGRGYGSARIQDEGASIETCVESGAWQLWRRCEGIGRSDRTTRRHASVASLWHVISGRLLVMPQLAVRALRGIAPG